MSGGETDTREQYERARRDARALGFSYVEAAKLGARPIEEIVRRLEASVVRGAVDDERQVAATLGGVAKPKIRSSGLMAEYEAQARASLQKPSPDPLK